jgi:hypothetical protein
MADELVVFTAFVALAQIIVGLVLLLAGFSSAVHIIGIVVLVLGCLSALGPLLGHFRSRRRAAEGAPAASPGEPIR